MPDFFRFPTPPHRLAGHGRAARRQSALARRGRGHPQRPRGAGGKLDGANLGFSVSPDGVLRAQNRGQYLPQPFHGQFARLGPWLAAHEDKLFDALGTHLVAFGEWCAARHRSTTPPFPTGGCCSMYDRQEQRFWSTTRRNAWAAEMGFKTVPRLYAGEVTLDQLRDWVHAHDSQFRQGHLEGIVVRRENADWLENRANWCARTSRRPSKRTGRAGRWSGTGWCERQDAADAHGAVIYIKMASGDVLP